MLQGNCITIDEDSLFDLIIINIQDLANHLVGLKQTYVKMTFLTTHDLVKVRKDILSAVRRNKERQKTATAYADMIAESLQSLELLSLANGLLSYFGLAIYSPFIDGSTVVEVRNNMDTLVNQR